MYLVQSARGAEYTDCISELFEIEEFWNLTVCKKMIDV